MPGTLLPAGSVRENEVRSLEQPYKATAGKGTGTSRSTAIGGTSYHNIAEEHFSNRYREAGLELSEGDYRDLTREAFSRPAPEECGESLQQGWTSPAAT